MDEGMRLILEANRIILRDRTWNNGSYRDKALIIDKEISELLNPKQEQPVENQTKDALFVGKKE